MVKLMDTIDISYVYWLVVASILISIVASYAAFSFAERVAASEGHWSKGWLIAGPVAMGLGIWSMHYLGMLAVQLPIEVVYHVPTVFFSLLLAIAAASATLQVVSHEKLSRQALIVGSLAMGGGIGAMHYTGMAAMRSSAMHRYNHWLVVLSIVVAVVFSWMSLRLTFSLRREPGKHELQRLGGAVLMGIGIAAMHYTAMFAVTFTQGNHPYSTVDTVPVDHIDRMAIVLVTALVLFGSLISAFVDRKMNHELRIAHERIAETHAILVEREKELQEAVAKLEELSNRDGLTSVYNRRFFDMTVITECKRAGRANYPISLLLVDVDHFKALNDRYGHLAGDSCLRQIGESLTNAVRRPPDIVARYGGEEFAVILPYANEKGAASVGEKLRYTILDLKIENENSPVNKFVTLSIGACTLHPSHLQSNDDIIRAVNEMIHAADEALYSAKRQGRNRVLLAA
jgi:diguanylate cyclase (GGDEF)-like protein